MMKKTNRYQALPIFSSLGRPQMWQGGLVQRHQSLPEALMTEAAGLEVSLQRALIGKMC